MDEITREHLRPAPGFLTDAQMAARAKRTGNIKTARKAVKDAVRPGQEFVFPDMDGEQPFVGHTLKIDRFEDLWCYVIVPVENKDGTFSSRSQNFGYARVLTWLKAAKLA